MLAAPLLHCAGVWQDGASLTRTPTDSLTSHISVDTLWDQASFAASLVISDSAAALKYDQVCVSANSAGVFALLGAADPLTQKI